MSSPASTANDGPQGRIAGFLSFLRNGPTRWAAAGYHANRAQAEEGSPLQERGRALQAEPVHPQQAAACRRLPSSGAAVKHSIPHGVVSQVVSPEIASFMEGSRVVVRTHQDELCCVDTVEVVARDLALCTVVECLGQYPQLVRLKFETAVVDAAVLAAVGNLSQLQHLDLSCCDGVDVAGLAAVAKLSQLQRLDLHSCRGVDSVGLAAVGNLSQLQHLDLSRCDHVDAAGLAAVAELSQLQHLRLNSCRGIHSAGLAAVGKLSQLQHLDLSCCDVAGLAAVGSLSQLQHLMLHSCRGVDAAGLAAVSNLSRLRQLDLSWCDGIDSAGLATVGNLTHLQHLNLSCCRGVDAAGLAAVGNLSQLQHLDIDPCRIDAFAPAEVQMLKLGKVADRGEPC